MKTRIISRVRLNPSSRAGTSLRSNHWAKEYICVLYGNGIIVPDKNGRFSPNAPLTRKEAVRMINNCLGIYPDTDKVDAFVYENGYKFTDIPHYSDYYYDIMTATLEA